MTSQNSAATETMEIHLARRSPSYWRVTFDHPPLNIFGPETIPQLSEIITSLETDKQAKVVAFDSAVEGFFLTHYDFRLLDIGKVIKSTEVRRNLHVEGTGDFISLRMKEEAYE